MAGPALLLLRAMRTLGPSPVLSPVLPAIPGASLALQPGWRWSPSRCLQLSFGLSAGHNKWSKVKNVKGPKDVARGKVFSKLSMMIRIAVKDGGPNPDLNLNLAHLVEQCRSNNMPKASIDAVIKAAEKAKPASQHMLEARGPGGCLLLIEVLTDNLTRTNQEIKRLLNKNGGTPSDGARHNFERRGVVTVAAVDVTTDKALELAIEAGAEDVQETEDEEEKPLLQFICDKTDIHAVRASLEKLGMQIMSSGVEFFPRTLLPLDEVQLDAASTLIDAISDVADVVRVWDNISADS